MFGKRVPALLAAVALAVSGTVVTTSPASAAPWCGITWGSAHKHLTLYDHGSVTDVRSGRHACFDRLVIDVAGPARGFSVRYVDVVLEPGRGWPVPVRGSADLEIAVLAPAYDPETWQPTYEPANRTELVRVSGYETFRQVAMAGSFEGTTTLALGVRARLPMRAFALPGPGNTSRVVVDVAHRW